MLNFGLFPAVRRASSDGCRHDPTGKTPKTSRLFCPTSQAHRAKRFAFPNYRSCEITKPSRALDGGRFAIVTTRGAGCDGRYWCADDAHRGVRSSRVVLIPRRWDQANGDDPFATGASKPGTPGRARSKP